MADCLCACHGPDQPYCMTHDSMSSSGCPDSCELIPPRSCSCNGHPQDEKPLHVRVAEALGCKTAAPTKCKNVGCQDLWVCACDERGSHNEHPDFHCDHLPCYDTDWAVTGPLMEQVILPYRQFVLADWINVVGSNQPARYQTYFQGLPLQGWGDTPLLAICNLILVLKEKGKL